MKKLSLLLALCTTFLSLFAQFDLKNPKTFIIGGITVKGAEHTTTQSVIEGSGLAIGDEIILPSTQTSDIMQRLWKLNSFEDIHIDAEKFTGNYVFLTISVKERPRISAFGFNGITKSQADDLREKINFIRGTVYSESKVQTAKRIIRNHYIEKGFYGVKVDFSNEEDKVIQNGVVVNIKVNRGKKIKINDIIVDGNTAYDDNKAVRKLKGIKEKKWWRVWARSKFEPKDYDKAKEALITAYNNDGYRDAQIEFDTVYNHDTKSIDVKLKVYEGKKYYFRNLTWVGNYKYNSLLLREVLGIKKGDSYSREKLDKKLSGNPDGGDVSSLYLDDGYLFFQVDPVEILVDGDSIDLEMRVFEGPQATIRRVTIEGNNKTSDYVILRELRTIPGDKFRRSDLIRSQREILALGYFDQEKINVVPIPDMASGTVDIKYVVEEKPSDQLQLQGGWGARPRNFQTGQAYGTGFTGTLQLSFNNFSTKRFLDRDAWKPVPSGDGQKLNLSFQSTIGATVVSASFMEPWFGGKKPNSLGFSSSYSVFNYNSGTTAATNRYRSGILTMALDYGRRLKFPDDFFQSYSTLVYKYFDINNPANVFPGFTGVPWAAVNIFSFKHTFSRSSIDAPLYPRSGSTMTFSTEFSPPYSLFRGKGTDYANMTPNQKYNLLEFHRWRFSSDWYFRIAGNLVLRTKVDAGFLGAYNRNLGVAPMLRYYLGGSGMMGLYGGQWDGREVVALRGYKDMTIVLPPEAGSSTPNGNAIFNKVSMEMRYPITLNQASPIWVLGFAEAGNGYSSFKTYNPFRLHRSVGAGVRVMLPMVGLLGLDWGYGFDGFDLYNPSGNQATLKGQGAGSNFHFILGQSF